MSSLIKNVEDENLSPMLTVALFLLLERARLNSDSSRENFTVGASDQAAEEIVSRVGLAGVHAVADVLTNIDGLLAKRMDIQRRRRRSDAEVFAGFRRPFAPTLDNERYLELSVKLRALFDLDRLFTRQRATRVLVLANGDSERMRLLAQNASKLTEVVLASEKRAPTMDGVSVTPVRDEEYLRGLLVESDIVIVEPGANGSSVVVESTPGLVAVDLDGHDSVDPALLERADVLLCRSDDARTRWLATIDDATRLVVVPDDPETALVRLRAVVAEPWAWRRRPAERGLPEDLRALLAIRRTREGGEGRLRRIRRAVWSLQRLR